MDQRIIIAGGAIGLLLVVFYFVIVLSGSSPKAPTVEGEWTVDEQGRKVLVDDEGYIISQTDNPLEEYQSSYTPSYTSIIFIVILIAVIVFAIQQGFLNFLFNKPQE